MPEPTDDPFKKVREELENFEASEEDASLTLEQRLQKAMDEVDQLTPDDAIDAERERLERNVSEAVPELPNFDDRLARLEQAAREARGRHETVKHEQARKQTSDGESARGLGIGLTVAYAILGMPLLGAGLGWLIDRQMGTSNYMGILCTIGAIVGVVFAVMTTNRRMPK